MDNQSTVNFSRSQKAGIRNIVASDMPPIVPGLHLLSMIGHGAFGTVWLAQNAVTRTCVAVKIVPFEKYGANARLVREMEAVIRFETEQCGQPENLLSIRHVGQTDAFLYYTMDAADDVSGEQASDSQSYRPATLQALIENPVRLSTSMIVEYSRQLLSGLAWLHDRRLVHRDVKPANCIVVNGRVRLADFGLLAKTDFAVSRIGTPSYMPPGPMDARADVYAAGLTIYQLLTGLSVGEFPRLGATSQVIRNDSDLRQINQAILKACSPQPEERFQNAKEMLDAISRPPQSKTRLFAAIVMCFLLFLSATVWRLIEQPSNPSSSPPASTVNIDFITTPFEAEIFIDGKRMEFPDGMPKTTPCTIRNLPTGFHNVTFRKQGRSDIDMPSIDFSSRKEVEAKWKVTR